MVNFLPDHNVVFFAHKPAISTTLIDAAALFPDPTVFAWSYRWPPYLREFCERRNIPLQFVEDGFIRGCGLGVAKTKPLSLCFDQQAMHFDRERPSDLEMVLATYNFAANPSLMAEARKLRRYIQHKGITKYNFDLDLGKDAARQAPVAMDSVLVMGQVDDDASIEFGMSRRMNSNDLVRAAVSENPDRLVRFRPHPETLMIRKPHRSDPAEVADICEIVPKTESLQESLNSCSLVYTMTSLAGFEAVLHGLPVRVFGSPFYAGWGFTDDVEPIARRSRKLCPVEVLAGAYCLYPRYFDPETDRQISALEAVQRLAAASDGSVSR